MASRIAIAHSSFPWRSVQETKRRVIGSGRVVRFREARGEGPAGSAHHDSRQPIRPARVSDRHNAMVTGPWLSSLIARGSSTWHGGVGSRSSIARSWPTPILRCRRTRSSGAGRTRSCSRASSAATSGRRTASPACVPRAVVRARGTSVEVLQPGRRRLSVSERVRRAEPRAASRRLPGEAGARRFRPGCRASSAARSAGWATTSSAASNGCRARSPTTWACPSSASRSPTRS